MDYLRRLVWKYNKKADRAEAKGDREMEAWYMYCASTVSRLLPKTWVGLNP